MEEINWIKDVAEVVMGIFSMDFASKVEYSIHKQTEEENPSIDFVYEGEDNGGFYEYYNKIHKMDNDWDVEDFSSRHFELFYNR